MTIVTDNDRRLLDLHEQELRALEERYGSQRLALEVRPDLVETARALQRKRAQATADSLGLTLRGDGQPLPEVVLTDLEHLLAGWVAAGEL